MAEVTLLSGDCRELLPRIPDNSVDFAFTDPPYPHVKRPYGYWTEKTWRELVDPTITECRRILKPEGSMLVVLQPNSEKVGQMRGWVWRFLADWSERWNIVQDVYWWNYTTPPNAHCQRRFGLMRGSVKLLCWLGSPNCYRNQEEVLWEESQFGVVERAAARVNPKRRERGYTPGGVGVRRGEAYALSLRRGGVTPFNLLPFCNANWTSSSGAFGHGAGTPEELTSWWIRYCCPPEGTVLDPFLGGGTTAVVGRELGRKVIGVEASEEYLEMARKRLKKSEYIPTQRS